jgi:hypothetical protein
MREGRKRENKKLNKKGENVLKMKIRNITNKKKKANIKIIKKENLNINIMTHKLLASNRSYVILTL